MKKHKSSSPAEQHVRKTMSRICKLVPRFPLPVDLEAEILGPLSTADFYTRRQAMLMWDINSVLLQQITSITLTGTAAYLAEHDEDAIIDYWASAMDRMLTDIYHVFTQSSAESFLGRYRLITGLAKYGTS